MEYEDKELLIGIGTVIILTIIVVGGILLSVKINADKEIKLKQIEVYGEIPIDVLKEEK